MANLYRSLVYLSKIITLLVASFLVVPIHALDSSVFVDERGLDNTKAWIDPAPVPVDPTDPRDPKPPSPLPYPEPPIPTPMPISPSLQELIEIIKELEQEIHALKLKILTLETKLKSRQSSVKNKSIENCDGYIKKLRKAIIELAKKDKAPELFSKSIDRSLLARLFESQFLDSIPPFHHKIKGSLETNLYCNR